MYQKLKNYHISGCILFTYTNRDAMIIASLKTAYLAFLRVIALSKKDACN